MPSPIASLAIAPSGSQSRTDADEGTRMTSTPSPTYDVYALRYASRPTMASDKFYRYELYGEPDKPYRTDYFFWLVRNSDRTVLVDCGFSEKAAATRNRQVDTDPV